MRHAFVGSRMRSRARATWQSCLDIVCDHQGKRLHGMPPLPRGGARGGVVQGCSRSTLARLALALVNAHKQVVSSRQPRARMAARTTASAACAREGGLELRVRSEGGRQT